MEEEISAPILVRENIKINTAAKGEIIVPALTHPNAPGLAVTMCDFGVFEVTHIPSGFRMTGRHERMGSALLLLSQFSKIAKAYSFSWADLNKEQSASKINELGDDPVPFDGFTSTCNGETKPGLIKEWLRTLNMYTFDSIFGEFPWEESNPLDDAIANLS